MLQAFFVPTLLVAISPKVTNVALAFQNKSTFLKTIFFIHDEIPQAYSRVESEVACASLLNRKFIGIERDLEYCSMARERNINAHSGLI